MPLFTITPVLPSPNTPTAAATTGTENYQPQPRVQLAKASTTALPTRAGTRNRVVAGIDDFTAIAWVRHPTRVGQCPDSTAQTSTAAVSADPSWRPERLRRRRALGRRLRLPRLVAA